MTLADLVTNPTTRGYLVVAGSTVGGFLGQVVALKHLRKVVRQEMAPTVARVEQLALELGRIEKFRQWASPLLTFLKPKEGTNHV